MAATTSSVAGIENPAERSSFSGHCKAGLSLRLERLFWAVSNSVAQNRLDFLPITSMLTRSVRGVFLLRTACVLSAADVVRYREDSLKALRTSCNGRVGFSFGPSFLSSSLWFRY